MINIVFFLALLGCATGKEHHFKTSHHNETNCSCQRYSEKMFYNSLADKVATFLWLRMQYQQIHLTLLTPENSTNKDGNCCYGSSPWADPVNNCSYYRSQTVQLFKSVIFYLVRCDLLYSAIIPEASHGFDDVLFENMVWIMPFCDPELVSCIYTL